MMVDDTISRQAAIDVILAINDYGNSDRANALGLAEFKITTLPTAERRGHWVRVGKEFGFAFDNFYCSECNYFSGTKTTNYCPNCGADMRERSDNGQND